MLYWCYALSCSVAIEIVHALLPLDLDVIELYIYEHFVKNF